MREKSERIGGQLEEFNGELKEIIDKKTREVKELEEGNARLRLKVATL